MNNVAAADHMISIIIPAYNSAATIIEALESVAAQTLWAKRTLDHRLQTLDQGEGETLDLGPSGAKAMEGQLKTLQSNVYGLKSNVCPQYEVIVVDDCSSDNTVEEVREWMATKSMERGEPSAEGRGQKAAQNSSHLTSHVSCFTLHSLPANVGPARARNEGIALARGEWIAFLDADDAWLPGKMELQMAFLENHPELAMICGDYIGFADDKTIEDGRQKTVDGRQGTVDGGQYFHPITLEELACHNPVATSTVVVKKAVLEVVGGFDEQFRGPEDYDLWIRIAALQVKALTIDHGLQPLDSNVGGAERKSNVNGLWSRVSAVDECIIMHISVPVSCYRQRAGSLSMDDRKFLPQVLRVLDKAWKKGGALHGKGGQRRARGYHHLACAWMAAERGVLGRAVVLWIMAVYYWPLPLRGRHQNIPWAHVKVAWRILSQVKRRCFVGAASVMTGAIR